ncbi:hypothetical protein [Pectobacterium versatile]|uniref:hypothetical protein n=1 Tax=Pectobacterium versatile TaxID=2488639 RepID=UPI001F4435C8|nr:hypothetical protein [Pectobacterium versatile]
MNHYGWSLQTAKILLQERFVTDMQVVFSHSKQTIRRWEIHFKTRVGDEAKLLTNGYSDKSRIGTRRFASQASALKYIDTKLPEARKLLKGTH